jgi:hypothetical protein
MYQPGITARRARRAFVSTVVGGTSCLLCACGGGNGNGNGYGATAPTPSPPMTSTPPPPTPTPNPPPTAMSTLKGTVNAIEKSLPGASVVVYRVGTHGYGSTATQLASATTDTMGNWTVSFATPSDDPLVYVVANGGDAGNGANSAIGLLTVLGPLSGAPAQIAVNEVTTIASVYSVAQFLDRPTATNIGSAVANVVGLPNAMANVRNLVDVTTGAALTTANVFTPLLNPVTHASEAPPGPVINSLAETLTACIGSSGPTSMPCNVLFGVTTPPGGSPPTDTRQAVLTIARNPESQVAALFQLARASAGVFSPDLGSSMPNDWTLAINFTGGAFSGSSPTGTSSPSAIAIDAEGDAWVTSTLCNPAVTNSLGCIVALSPQGAPIGTFPGAGSGIKPDLLINEGGALAVGTNPNTGQELVWLASEAPSAVYALDAHTGQFLFGGAMTLGGVLRNPESLQVDLLGNLWVANSNPRFLTDGATQGSVFEVSPGSANDYSQVNEFDFISPLGGPPPSFTDLVLDGNDPATVFVTDANGVRILQFDGAHPGVQVPPMFASPDGNAPGPLAIDASGNVWAANSPASHNPAGALELLKGVGAPGYVERDLGGNSINFPGEPGGIAIDGAGNAWVANTDAAGNKGVVELAPNGSSITAATGLGAYNGASPPSGGPLGSAIVGTSPRGLAIDSSGNVWVATGDTGGVVELVGAAAPVRTPLNTRSTTP